MTAATYAGAASTNAMVMTSQQHPSNGGMQGGTGSAASKSLSFPLMAAQLATVEIAAGQTVYLVDRQYLQNWFNWALHQTVPSNERDRLRETLRLAAWKLGLVPPDSLHHGATSNGKTTIGGGASYHDPGPIDSTSLSVEGHPLLLSPLVQYRPPKQLNAPEPLSNGVKLTNGRTRSLNGIGSSSWNPIPDQSTLIGNGGAVRTIQCLAVPESFYETLRAVHGVLCEDGYSVSFQPHMSDSERILLHHQYQQQQRHRYESNTNNNSNDSVRASSRPVEFRRKVILEQPKDMIQKTPTTLMDKLLLEEQNEMKSFMVPVIEVHPVKLMYTVLDDSSEIESSSSIHPLADSRAESLNLPETRQGFCLVARSTTFVDALMAVMRVAAPNKSTQSVRLWAQPQYSIPNIYGASQPTPVQGPTESGDGFELVDFSSFLTNRGQARGLSVQGWVERLSSSLSTSEDGNGANNSITIPLLVETRKTANSPWARRHLELEERIQVGDLVDAQDVAGRWYEAVIRKVDTDTVTVHYVGWSSRWDNMVKRRHNSPAVEGASSRVQAPSPLWSMSGRWRERVKVGDMLEVRDASSIVQRPKWYKGIVRRVGKPNDPIRPMINGAELEEYEDPTDPTKKEKLLLMGQTQQILVEVEQERTDKPEKHLSTPLVNGKNESDILHPDPPYRRWVNLYGEEICALNTHLKDDMTGGPVTLRYDLDGQRKPVEIMKSHGIHGSGFMRESLRGTPPAPGSVGLHNLGNSCYLNSIVQCLNHIEPLSQYFLQNQYISDLNRVNPLGSGGNVATAYASLLHKMWGGQYSVLAPRALKQTVAAFAPQFDNCYQHDSHEFCQFLMDGLHEDLNRVKTKPYVEELEGFGLQDQKAAIESWRKHLLRHDSVIVDYCQGMHRSHLTCPQCGRESIKFDVFSSISLPIVPDKKRATSSTTSTPIKLEDCLEKFMEGEQLDDVNAWYCPNCRKHVCALKMIALWTVPDILILHLKRFTFDTCLTSGGMVRSKIDDKVIFPIEGLDLSKHILGPIDLDAPPIYRLFGVSEHSGPTGNSGHYTATIRNSIDGHWYRTNDSHVGQTSGEAAITGGAYVLFYQRTKGQSRWAGMDKIMNERHINPYNGYDADQDGFRKVKAKKKKK